jgi:hypothetical protein
MDFPFRTSPKTTCLRSRWGVGTVVTKNWEPLVPNCKSLLVLNFWNNDEDDDWGSRMYLDQHSPWKAGRVSHA